MGQSRRLTGINYQSVRQNILHLCMRSDSRPICIRVSVHSQGVPVHPAVGVAFETTSVGSTGGAVYLYSNIIQHHSHIMSAATNRFHRGFSTISTITPRRAVWDKIDNYRGIHYIGVSSQTRRRSGSTLTPSRKKNHSHTSDGQ